MLPITPEMHDALSSTMGWPVKVTDEATQKSYFLVEAGRDDEFVHDWLNRQIQLGIDDIEAGRVVEFDAEAIKRRGRELLRERGNQA